jgi:hypothetical protein
LEYCSIITHKQGDPRWEERLRTLLDARNGMGERSYAQVAVMFRSNDEVFKAFNSIQNEFFENIRIKIQGGEASPYRSREFYYFIESFRNKTDQVIESNFIETFNEIKSSVIKDYPNWNLYLINLLHCCIYEFLKVKDENDTYEGLIDFLFDISHKDDGQLGKIYQSNIQRFGGQGNEQEIILTTMHKVKGIEFDAVLIPPSFSSLPLIHTEHIPLNDLLEEERRLYYVAYSRAKYRLIVIKHHREIYLDNKLGFSFPDQVIRNLGVSMPSGINKLNISWAAGNFAGNSFTVIQNQLKLGDSILLKKEIRGGFTFWNIYSSKTKIGQLKSGIANNLTGFDQITGFNISSIERYTYEETLKYDELHETTFGNNWTNVSKERGFIYLVDFSGFGKELSLTIQG